MAEDAVRRAQRAIGMLLVPRSGDGAAERQAALAAVQQLLDLASEGQPDAIDEVRRIGLRRGAVQAIGVSLPALLAVVPVGWQQQIIEAQQPPAPVCADLGEQLPPGAARSDAVRRGLAQCGTATDASVARRLLRSDPTLDAVDALLRDQRRMHRLGLSPAEVLLALGSSGRHLIGPDWPETELRVLLAPGVDIDVRSAAVDALLARPEASVATWEDCLAASADGAQRARAARRLLDQIGRSIASLRPDSASTVDGHRAIEQQVLALRTATAKVDGLFGAEQLLAQLDSIDAQLAAQVPHRFEAELDSLATPRLPFERWRAGLEHLARRAEVAASRSGEPYVRHWLEDIADRARHRILDPGLVPSRPPSTSFVERPMTCAWCGAWCGLDWNHCGSCGAIRRRHVDPPDAWSVAPRGVS